ncbi:MAG: right-handed parallel beta-helix repeat-containing protein [Candidatus Parabeggiatoa sp.]|nr:right-handed parallel beta-helix repeat-containing protein [Candidatus Parabeggiatoa sp.]
MSFNTLISTALSTLLKEGTIVEILLEKAGEKAIAIFQAHFTFSAFEIANSYQNSYTYALAAICTGLATPEQKMRFLQKWTHSKIEREFADQIEQLYFQPFALQCGVQTEAEQRRLRRQLIDNIKKLTHFSPIFSAEKRDLTESELAAFIHYQGTLAITDLILKHNHTLPDYQAVRDETVEAFFRFEELLGNATLFFLYEIFRTDERAKATIAALQREALWLDVRDIKTTQEKLLTRLEEEKEEQNAKAMQALQGGDFAQAAQLSSHLESLQKDINKLPDTLEAAQAAWQNTHQHWVAFAERFHSWRGMLNAQLSEVLAETQTLHGEIEAVHDDVKANLAKSEEMAEELKALKQLMANLMARFDLSAQLKPSDEFTHHNSSSLKQIQAAIAKLSALPSHHPNYNQVVIMGGSLLSSTGDMAAAEKLFLQAFNQAIPDSADKALASFNLFLVRLLRKDYDHALVDLQTAIDCERRYALHDVEKYPMVRLLGAGGMGCVFLCHDQWGEKQVVVKCFWEGRKGTRQAVFGEAMIMRQVAGAYVPAPLDCGYVDAHRQERPYFVSEYIEGAVDGENWLAQYGAFDISTGIAVGIEIAKGLKVAHEKGIYHLDLKPANLLLKRTTTGLRVKIIDFGLARVATSLRQEAMSRRTTAGMTQFGQAIVGTILYAAPEQMGEVEYGKPGAKSDLYALGATLYRLMTNESPRTLNPRRLSDAPPALFDLLCHCKEEYPAQRPDSAAEVLKRLESLLTLATTIVVSPTGDCQTISAAIKKAKAGDRILVKQGVYQEDLVIDKPLEIIGEGDVKEIVVESQNANCIYMKTDHALVRGLSLHNRAEKRFAVNIPQGQLTLEYCDMTSDSLSCIGIHGNEAEGIVRHCKIHDGNEPGIMVYDNGTGQIENCDIFGNALAGIEIKTGGNPVVQHCQIHDSKKSTGVLVFKNGTGQKENCDIFGNAYSGIEIREGGNPVVQKCTIKKNAYQAVYVHDGGAGTIENCDLRDNPKGVWYIESGCQVRRSGNVE